MGTLARAPLVGGAPREVLEQVQWADWSADGTSLAVVRDMGGRQPAGISDRQTALRNGRMDRQSARFSERRPDRVYRSSACRVTTVGRSPSSIWLGRRRPCLGNGSRFKAWRGLRMANEIWFTASKSGMDRTLYATTLDGKERIVRGCQAR